MVIFPDRTVLLFVKTLFISLSIPFPELSLLVLAHQNIHFFLMLQSVTLPLL